MKTIRFSNFFKSVKILTDEDTAAAIGSGRPIRECLPEEQIAAIESRFSTRQRPCNWNDLVAWDAHNILSCRLRLS